MNAIIKIKMLIISIIVYSLSFTSPIFIFAQPRDKVDSLVNLLPTVNIDTMKIKIYGQLAWIYASTRDKLDSAKIFADSIFQIAERINDERGVIYAHFYYGTIDRHAGNLMSSLKHFEKYVDFHEKKGNTHLVATGKYQLGTIQKALGNYDKSLQLLYQVLEIHEARDYKYGIGFTANVIAGIQRTLKNHDLAIENYHRSISLFRSLNEQSDLAMSLENLGNVYAELSNFDSALFYYKQALAIDTKLNKKYGIASELENMGNLYLQMGETKMALNYQLKSLRLRKELPQKRELAISLNQMGKIYRELNDLNNAENYLKKSLILSSQINAKPEILRNYKELASLYEQKKDFYQANEFQKQYNQLSDSLLNEEKLRQINELETQYQTAKKDQEILLLSKENEINEAKVKEQAIIRNALMGIIILILTVSILIYNTFKQKLKNQRIIAEKNEEIRQSDYKRKLTDLELKALRSQMNPHFIFNCMNSINRMILSGDSKEASKYLNRFARLIRLTLENSESNYVSLADELEMLETYIHLESIRFKGKVSYSIKVDKSIDPANTTLPSMVLQPFIENAIWHGLMHQNKPGQINIKIHEEDEILKCTIEDNGVGREVALKLKSDSKSKNQSLGLKITEERLKLISHSQLENLIRIDDLKDDKNKPIGTRVNISIPLN